MNPLILILALAACGGPEPGPGDSTASGDTTWRDAATDHDGMTRPPDHPASQPARDPMRVTVEASGTGTFDLGDPSCQADALTGAFEGLYQGDADVDDDGAYVAVLAESDASFETPSGCAIPSLSLGAVTDLVVRGELSATTENCDGYCAARARAEAESACDGDPDEASCRATEEASWEASCSSSCESTDHVIVGEASLGASSLLDLTLDGASFGDVTVDLELDHVEDGQGDTVDDTP